MKKHRYYEIDILKSISALTVIFIHVTGRYKGTEPYINSIWIWSHFAVGAFVIASGFLLARHNDTLTKLRDLWEWFKKRFVRLAGPYFVYLAVHATLIILIPSIFNRVDIEPSAKFICNTVLLHSGFGQNWIPRLFILLSVAYVLIQLIRSKFKLSTHFYTILFLFSLAISAAFLHPSIQFSASEVKYVQTVTWLPLMLFGMMLFYNKDSRKWTVSAALISGIIFLVGYLLLPQYDISQSVFAHKYPPTLYFIVYNIFVGTLLLLIARLSNSFLRSHNIISKSICFLSRHSYTIFFAHVIIMDIFEKPTGFWLTDYILITLLTIVAVIVWTYSVTFVRAQISTRKRDEEKPLCP